MNVPVTHNPVPLNYTIPQNAHAHPCNYRCVRYSEHINLLWLCRIVCQIVHSIEFSAIFYSIGEDVWQRCPLRLLVQWQRQSQALNNRDQRLSSCSNYASYRNREVVTGKRTVIMPCSSQGYWCSCALVTPGLFMSWFQVILYNITRCTWV